MTAPKSTARELSKEAKRDYDEGRFDEAARKFQQAFDATEVPSLGLWTARSLAKQGKLVAASELYRKVATLQKNELWVGKVQEQARLEAAQELQQLLPRLARLIIQVKGNCSSELQVTVDGTQVPSSLLGVARTTDPGSRRIVAQCGSETVQQDATLAEGVNSEVSLVLKASVAETVPTANVGPGSTAVSPPGVVPATASSPALTSGSPAAESASRGAAQQTLGWVGVGVGAAGLIIGTATGLIVKSRYNSYDCGNGGCDPDKSTQSQLDSSNTLRSVSTVSIIVGGIGLATGVTLLLTNKPKSTRSNMALWVGPASAGLKGSF